MEYIIQELEARPERINTMSANEYKYVLVDDVQDLTELHFQLLKAIFLQSRGKEGMDTCKSFTVSGDDDQAVYVYVRGNWR